MFSVLLPAIVDLLDTKTGRAFALQQVNVIKIVVCAGEATQHKIAYDGKKL